MEEKYIKMIAILLHFQCISARVLGLAIYLNNQVYLESTVDDNLIGSDASESMLEDDADAEIAMDDEEDTISLDDADVNDIDPELDGLDINNEDEVSLEEK